MHNVNVQLLVMFCVRLKYKLILYNQTRMRVEGWLSVTSMVWYNIMGLFCLSRYKCESEIARSITFVHGVVCLINGFCVFLGLANLDRMNIRSREVSYLRYVEWTICTPLMTYEMCLASRISKWEINTILVFTIAFCICGSIAALTSYQWAKLVLGVKGSIYCIIVLYKLGYACFRGNPSDFMSRVGYYNFIVTLTLWPLYVFTWGLGPDVYSIISAHDEIYAQHMFSLILKSCAAMYSILTFNFDIEAFEEVIIELANQGVQGPSLIAI